LARLIFIGLGLHDGTDISIMGMEAVKGFDKVFAEFYTARLTGTDLAGLEALLGKEIRVLDRKEVEEGDLVVEAAKEGTVAFLCAGDPMSATTHLDLRLRAIGAGIDTSVVHGPSIFTAAASLLGLQQYKFGRTTTIPYPQEGYSPSSPYDVIAENRGAGLHTLVLLDIDADGDRLMTANEALDILTRLEGEKGAGVVAPESLVCVVARVGSEAPLARAGYVMDLMKEDFGPPHHSLVVPGKLHFMEAEALVKLAGAPKDILV
jgi:diphthine synthase